MIRGVWSYNTVAWVLVCALLPVLLILIFEQGSDGAIWVAFCLAVVGLWQIMFRLLRGQLFSPSGPVTAIAVMVLAPGDLAFWQLTLALTFGILFGELIFGGWGRNVFSGAVIVLAFLFLSFPETSHPPADGWVAIACAPAALLLLLTGILSWRIMAAALVGLVTVTILFDENVATLATQGSLVFGLVFLVGDPVASASTNPGRIVYGALAGSLAGLFGWAGAGIGMPQPIVFAALVGSVFAPLIDYFAVGIGGYIWRRRHG